MNMALATCTISGHILTPSGAAPSGGKLTARLSVPGSALDGTETVRVAQEVTADFTTGGAVTLALTPNDSITPSGTHYLVTIVATLASGRRVNWSERWQLTGTAPLDIGSVPRLDVVPGVALAPTLVGVQAQADAAAASAAAAAGSADDAVVSAGAAASQVGLAADQVVLAQAARDAATVNAGVYGSTALGLAATSNGQQFQVVSGTEIIRYRNDSGTATEVARYPAASAVAALANFGTLTSETVRALMADAAGQVFMAVDTVTGKVLIPGAVIDLLTSAGATYEEIDGDFSGLTFAIADADDKIAFAIDRSGVVVVGSGASAGAAAPLGAVAVERFGFDINHILTNGQSLSIAGGLFFSIQDSGDLTFSGGVDLRTEETGNTLVPMASDSTAAAGWNVVQQAKAYMRGFQGLRADPLYNDDFPLLYSSHGMGGQDIVSLSKGGSTGCYEDMLWSVQEGQRIAAASGKSYGVQAIVWIQGESERHQTTAYYIEKFNAYMATARAEIAAITGQPSDFLVLTHQPSGNGYETAVGVRYANTVALATSEISEADGRVIPACPTYWVDHADVLHISPTGQAQLGAMMGKVFYLVAFRGEAWRPLEPIRITKHSPRVITVKFHVPYGPLVLDTVAVTDPGNYGFVVEDAGGDVAITSVALIHADTVRISLGADLGASPVVSYAYYQPGGNGGGPIYGARGCLRDSDPSVSLHGGPLHNWATVFRKSIPYVRA